MRHIFLCNKEVKSRTQPSKEGTGIKSIILSFEKIQQHWRWLEATRAVRDIGQI